MILTLFTALTLTVTTEAQQLNTPAPSPLQTVTQQFALSRIELSYSRPSMNGRKIFGGLVPYDKLWRTGANSCTKIYFGEDVTVNGTPIKQGRYAVFTIPGKTEWEIIINKDTNQGGTQNYKIENDVARFKVKSKTLLYNTETFTIDVNNMNDDSAFISMRWEKTEVTFLVKADFDAKVMEQINAAMNPQDKKPYFAAARYYYDNEKDLNKALEWVIKAEEMDTKAFWVTHLKAKIYLKKGDKAAALAAAESSKQKAREANNEDYVALNDKVIEDAKKLK